MSLLRHINGGCDYDGDLRTRMRGQDVIVAQLRRRFELACRRHGYQRARCAVGPATIPSSAGLLPQDELFGA